MQQRRPRIGRARYVPFSGLLLCASGPEADEDEEGDEIGGEGVGEAGKLGEELAIGRRVKFCGSSILMTSKVIAKAKTPSVNESSRLLGMEPSASSFWSDKPSPPLGCPRFARASSS